VTSSQEIVPGAAFHAPVVHAPALEMRGITKRYPGVVANDGIDLEVRTAPARRR